MRFWLTNQYKFHLIEFFLARLYPANTSNELPGLTSAQKERVAGNTPFTVTGSV